MNYRVIVDNLLSIVKKHVPDILIGIGSVGVVTGTVVACKETLKLNDILQEHKDEIDKIHEAAGDESNEVLPAMTEPEIRSAVTKRYAVTVGKVIGLYSGPGLIIAGSLYCIGKSHGIMKDRLAGLSAAYLSIAKRFEGYRKFMIDKHGEADDIEAMHGIKTKKIKGKNGEEDRIEYIAKDDISEHDFTRFFDADSKFWDRNVNMNLMQIHTAEVNLNRKAQTRKSHEVSFNEICAELDLRPDREKGNVIGIKFRPKDESILKDENGVAQLLKIMVYVFTPNGERVKKSVGEAISNGDRLDPVMLLDFVGLEPIA